MVRLIETFPLFPNSTLNRTVHLIEIIGYFLIISFFLLQLSKQNGQLGVLGRVATKIVSSTEEELAMLTHTLWNQSVPVMKETWHLAQEISALVSLFLYLL